MKFRLLAAAVAAVLTLGAGLWSASRSEAAPQSLSYSQTCMADGRVQVTFSWSDVNIYAVQQWLDLSLYDNDWQPGTFLGNGPLAAAQQSVTWPGLIANTTHYVRINQWLPSGAWEASPTFYITTPACPPSTAPSPVPTPTGDRESFLAPIESAKVVSSASQPGHFEVQAKAGLPSGCAQRGTTNATTQGTEIRVQIFDTRPTGNVACTAIYGIYDVSVDIGALAPGRAYTIFVNDKQLSFAVP